MRSSRIGLLFAEMTHPFPSSFLSLSMTRMGEDPLYSSASFFVLTAVPRPPLSLSFLLRRFRRVRRLQETLPAFSPPPPPPDQRSRATEHASFSRREAVYVRPDRRGGHSFFFFFFSPIRARFNIFGSPPPLFFLHRPGKLARAGFDSFPPFSDLYQDGCVFFPPKEAHAFLSTTGATAVFLSFPDPYARFPPSTPLPLPRGARYREGLSFPPIP